MFLKMADELTKAPYNQPNRIPKGRDKNGKPIDYDWPSLLKRDGVGVDERGGHVDRPRAPTGLDDLEAQLPQH